jgi:hypothetical protein
LSALLAAVTVRRATISTFEAVIVAAVQCVVFNQIFVPFSASFALTEVGACVRECDDNTSDRDHPGVVRLPAGVSRLAQIVSILLQSSSGIQRSQRELSMYRAHTMTVAQQVAHWTSAPVRVECLLHGVVVGVTMLVICTGHVLVMVCACVLGVLFTMKCS